MQLILKENQQKAIKFLYSLDRSFYIAPCGKGKTIVTLFLLKIKLEKNRIKRAMIVAPPRGIESYKKAFDKFSDFKKIKTIFLFSTNIHDYSIDQILSNDIIIISSSIFSKYESILEELKYNIQMLIVDEVHQLRSVNKYYKTMRNFLKNNNCFFLGLSATPWYSSLENIFYIFDLFLSGIVGNYRSFWDNFIIFKMKKAHSFVKMRDKFIPVQREYPDIIGYKNQDFLMQIISPYMHIEKDNEFQYNFSITSYDLNQKQRSEYLEIIQDIGNLFKYKVKEISSGKMKTLIQSFVPSDEIFEIIQKSSLKSLSDYSPKLIQLQKFLSKLEEKYNCINNILDERKGIVIFCNYIETSNFLLKKLKEDYPKRNIIILTGQEKKIEKKISLIKESDIVIITKVASQSLDFYIDTLLVFEPVTTPGLLDQLIGRITRNNASYREVNIYFSLCNFSIESYFYEKLLYSLNSSEFSIFKNKLPHSDSFQYIKNKKFSIRTLKDSFLWLKN